MHAGRPWRPCLHGDGRRRQRLLRLPGRFPARRFAIGREPGAFRRRWDAIGRVVRGGADRGGTERRRTPSGGCAGAWVRRGGGNRPAGGKGASTVRLLYGGWLVAPSPGLASEVAPAGEGGGGTKEVTQPGCCLLSPPGFCHRAAGCDRHILQPRYDLKSRSGEGSKLDAENVKRKR